MKVGVVCPYDLGRWGGVQTQCIELVAWLTAQGVDAVLVGPGSDRQEVAESGAPDPRRVVGKPTLVRANRSTVPLSLRPGTRRRVRLALRDRDVIHVHEPFLPLVSLAALSTRLPAVATFHAAPPGWVRCLYAVGSPVWRRLLGRARVTAVSPVAAEAPRRLGLEVDIVPLGLSPFPPNGIRNHHQVVFVGRDDPRKGLDTLLTAWRQARAVVPAAELLVVGASRVAEPGVTFLGSVDDSVKRRSLGTSTILCAPNLGGESFGLIIAEGMAAGCAIVCSDLPAFRATAGDSAVYVPPGDAAGLAMALIELLNDGERRQRLGGLGSHRVAGLAWDHVGEKYLRLYREALARR